MAVSRIHKASVLNSTDLTNGKSNYDMITGKIPNTRNSIDTMGCDDKGGKTLQELRENSLQRIE